MFLHVVHLTRKLRLTRRRCLIGSTGGLMTGIQEITFAAECTGDTVDFLNFSHELGGATLTISRRSSQSVTGRAA